MKRDCAVQCMHIGPYDNEPETVQMMDHFAKEQGYVLDFTSGRYHHEIYLSDVRRCKPENLKTVIRHPIRWQIKGKRHRRSDAFLFILQTDLWYNPQG